MAFNFSDLLKSVAFPGDIDPTYLLAVSGPEYRKDVIRGKKKKGFKDEIKIAASLEIQRIWRGNRTRLRIRELFARTGNKSKLQSIRVEGACSIQRAWRQYKNKKLFQSFQNLINFHRRGDPSYLLRCINPQEAKLLDRASGCYVRFRLGGETFPPMVYYKIFTNRTIVDLCASSPRDYTAMCERKLLAKELHNSTALSVPYDTSGWYRREENNGWRPIVLNEPSLMPKPVQPFRHLKLMRREDLEKKRKQKRIEWLTKLYTANVNGEEMEQEDGNEVDGLIQWSHELDYDKYISDWQSFGTSATTDPYTVQLIKA